jgi:hypothetical protein
MCLKVEEQGTAVPAAATANKTVLDHAINLHAWTIVQGRRRYCCHSYFLLLALPAAWPAGQQPVSG